MLLSAAMFAQSVPQTVNFSATVRDANNELLANTPINVRLTFYEGGESGTPVYCALHQTTTNANGFMSFQLNRNVLAYACNGAPNTPFEEIPWENGNYWMHVEYQAQIAGDFIDLGYLELTSGFYAFSANYALTAQKLDGFDIDVTNAQDGDILVYNGTTRKWEARRPENVGGGNGGGFNPFSCSEPTGSLGGHGYVDLGLPSGTLWATCNIGANEPTEYGNYYAWGETTPKEIYDWTTYRWCNGSNSTFTKYCYNSDYGNDGFTDNLTTLEGSDDAATVNWGTAWRMPTYEECKELKDYCYIINTGINGVRGQLVFGPNGNSIFLPASGSRGGSGLHDVGFCGNYWSSSLYTYYTDLAMNLYFNSDGFRISTFDRYHGVTVRPVCVSAQN